MKQVLVTQFGPPEVLVIEEVPTPQPGPGQVRIKVTSIGMNHAELMQRKGEYKVMSGDPPFTPGLEAGGIVEAVGTGVTRPRVGDRVILGADATRGQGITSGGTYRSHFICPAEMTVPAPQQIDDDQLGAIWLPYLTAWGCLVWKQKLQKGQIVGIPAASSSVGLAAAQVVKRAGGIAIGLTSTPAKVAKLKAMDTCAFDEFVLTHDEAGNLQPFHKQLKDITGGKGVNVFLDPVASGQYLEQEISVLADDGTIWLYGLLGETGPINMQWLIIKRAAIRGWLLYEVVLAGKEALAEGYAAILSGFADGAYRQRLGGSFKLDEVVHAHREMEKGEHIGKLVLIP